MRALRHDERDQWQAHADEGDLAIFDLARSGSDHQFAERVLFRGRVHHFPENFAVLFSTYEAIPSLASSLVNRRCCNSRSSASPDSIGSSQPVCTARLI